MESLSSYMPNVSIVYWGLLFYIIVLFPASIFPITWVSNICFDEIINDCSGFCTYCRVPVVPRPCGDSRLLNWLWPAKLCLGGALQFHHSAVRSCCVCASPYGLINECVHWQMGLLLRMWFAAFLNLCLFACKCDQRPDSVYLCVFACMCVYLPMHTCVCVFISVSWGLWSKRLPQPGVTFSHECIAYDTSSGLGQTSPDPSSNTSGWSPSIPCIPFLHSHHRRHHHLTAALSFSLNWTFSRHPTLHFAPCLPAPATAGLNLQLIGTLACFGCD